MVAFKSFSLAAVVVFSLSAFAAPLNCGWLGCPVDQKPFRLHYGVDITEVTPKQIIEDINQLTQKSQALQAPAQSISPDNGPLIIIGEGPYPSIVKGYVEIVQKGKNISEDYRNISPIGAGKDADAVNDAWREFAKVSSFTLHILVGKAAMFSYAPFIGSPLAAILRQYQDVVDTLAFQLIDSVESHAGDLSSMTDELSKAIIAASNAYNSFPR